MKHALRLAAAFLFGTLLFLGLPLLAWGPADAPAFFHHPARLAYCLLALALLIIPLFTLSNAGLSRPEGTHTVARQRFAVLLLQLLGPAIVATAPFTDRRHLVSLPGGDPFRYAGLPLFALGFLLMIWATHSLGKQFSVQVTIQKDHQLITHGPYRLIRHPRYAGILLFFTGYALIFLSLPALALIAPLTAVLAWRIHDEEALLAQQFGPQWLAYTQKSRRLIPFLY